MEKKTGFVGLGNMGMNMVWHLLEQGWEVHAYNRSEEPRNKVAEAGAKVYASIPDMLAGMGEGRKIVWSMVAAGSPVDEIISQLTVDQDDSRKMHEGDIFVDGVNSHYKQSQERAENLEKLGIKMLDFGVSGGIEAARHGACLMGGGDREAYDYIEDLLKDLATENGYGYFGKSGAGHYVKMIHNAIEYGMMQTLGEGINLISKSGFEVDLKKLTEVWSHRSIIAGNLMNFLHQALEKDSNLENAAAEIGSLGTGEWAVAEALEKQAPFTSIAEAVSTRYASRQQDHMINKVISALRTEFGGHDEKERPDNENIY